MHMLCIGIATGSTHHGMHRPHCMYTSMYCKYVCTFVCYVYKQSLTLMTLRSLLNLSISCNSTVERELMIPFSFGSNSSARPLSGSNFSGSLPRMFSASSATISSFVLPPPVPASRGCTSRMVVMSTLVSCVCEKGGRLHKTCNRPNACH